VIDSALAAGLERIAARERDVLHAFEPGFTPEASDAARTPAIVPAHDPLSVAAPEGGYFVTPDGAGRLAFTRDGVFHVADGELCDTAGRPVLGFTLEDRTSLAPLRVDPYDAALGRASGTRVDADGTFAYTRTVVDPRSGERRSERVVIGRLALARFPAGTQPQRIDAAHVGAPPGVTPQIGVPADGRFAKLATYARDLGRVDLVAGLEKMREAYVTFEALRGANHVRGALEKTAMDLVK